jgi:hypothetical protein
MDSGGEIALSPSSREPRGGLTGQVGFGAMDVTACGARAPQALRTTGGGAFNG